jgi:hypothetical protein
MLRRLRVRLIEARVSLDTLKGLAAGAMAALRPAEKVSTSWPAVRGPSATVGDKALATRNLKNHGDREFAFSAFRRIAELRGCHQARDQDARSKSPRPRFVERARRPFATEPVRMLDELHLAPALAARSAARGFQHFHAPLLLKSGVKSASLMQICPKNEHLPRRFMQQLIKFHKSSFSLPTVLAFEPDARFSLPSWQ